MYSESSQSTSPCLPEEGKIDPIIRCDNEICCVVCILCTRTENNLVLIGKPGVSKTSIASGLAQCLVNCDIPASLIACIFSLNMGMLMAGTKYKGKYKECIKCVLNEVEKAAADSGPSVILFIDELYLIMVSCGSEVSGMDAANLFKLLLAHRKLHRIVAMTLAEYRKYIKTDATLECQFAQVLINKPTVPKTISILRSICKKYEVHHGMQILNSTLIMAATLACCYLTAQWLPDSTINLVDEACASVHVTCKTAPEVINKLQCQKLELEV
ncbi:P-loop containing nucleoside triphosphate hydrolase protein [Russula earlei]|uniref:P-loop containing nucleoside triphosphate hydrolase protein n=1 Tax=Russula earlei TaxID=71964 RepID=A0ACC0TRF2_9AGAM|nr:P-loop containing nucleoside triphosphate hydrolase protein [Russula earlei]